MNISFDLQKKDTKVEINDSDQIIKYQINQFKLQID